MLALSRRLSRSAFAGLIAWAALLFAPLSVGSGLLEETAHLVLLAPLVLVPLYLDAAVPFSFEPRTPPLLAAASWLLLPGALAAAAAFLVPIGPLAGALTAPWVLATGVVALWGVHRAWGLRRQGRLDAPEALLTAGIVALPGGALWLSFSRFGIDPGPYGEVVVLLTAAHFHYAAFAAAVWGGLLGRTLASRAPALRRLHAALGAGLVGGFWLVAVGIAQSGGPAGAAALETVGVLVLAASAIGMGSLGLVVAPRFESRGTGLMIAVSGGALALSMGFAGWFHLGPRLGVGAPDVAAMLASHGWLNAMGFGLWGALGWRRLRPRPAAVPAGS